MPSFLAAAQCMGQRPKNLSIKRHFARPHLTAQLLQERHVPRYIVAPPRFGKTSVVYEYAATVFQFQHVFWVDGKSPCFLRDLDAQVIAETLLELDSDSFLVVIEDIPQMDSDRVGVFLSQIDCLLKKNVEIIITCTPSNDSFEAHHDRLKLSAHDLLLTDEEERSALRSHDSWSPSSTVFHKAYRIPALAWGDNQAVETFLASAARENAPHEVLRALFLLLVLQFGGRVELERLSLANDELLTILVENYPYIDIDLSAYSFIAAPFAFEATSKAFLPVLSKINSSSSLARQEKVGRMMADMLMSRGDASRACLLVQSLLTRPTRAVWLAEKGRYLFQQACIEPAHMVYESLGEERAGLSSYLQTGEVLRCYALGEAAWVYKTAHKLFGLRSAPYEVRALMGLILARENQLTNPDQLKTWSALLAHKSLHCSRRLENTLNEEPVQRSGMVSGAEEEISASSASTFSALLEESPASKKELEREPAAPILVTDSSLNHFVAGQQPPVSSLALSLESTSACNASFLTADAFSLNREVIPEYHLTSLTELLVALAVHEAQKTSFEKACSTWCRLVSNGARGNLVFLAALWIMEEILSELESQEDYARQTPSVFDEFLVQLKQLLLEESVNTPTLYAARVGAMALRACQNNQIADFELPQLYAQKYRAIELSLFEQRSRYYEEVVRQAERKRVWDETHPSLTQRSSTLELIPSPSKNVLPLTVNLFGGLEVFIGSDRVDPSLFRRQKVKTLLALLVLNKGREFSRDKLIELLWPESDRESARKNFYSIWSLLRQALTTPEGTCPYLIRQQQSLRIEGSFLRSDVQQLDEICRTLLFEQPDYGGWANLFAQVSEVYSDEILPSDCDNVALAGRRRECRDKLVDALVSASSRLVRAGEYREGLWFARAAMQRDGEREDVYTTLMEAQIKSGQRAAALETYFACRKFLTNELGIDPAAETMRLYHSIIEVDEVYQ